MKRTALTIAGLAAAFCLGFYFTGHSAGSRHNAVPYVQQEKQMKLGAFSISLSVKDLKVSRQFYEHLGFTVFAGSMEQRYLIMKNDNALIGLFEGMFEGNILTFNPGWDENAQNMKAFDDIREIQHRLRSKGITPDPQIDETTSGPASFMVTDPDGNALLFDQHR